MTQTKKKELRAKKYMKTKKGKAQVLRLQQKELWREKPDSINPELRVEFEAEEFDERLRERINKTVFPELFEDKTNVFNETPDLWRTKTKQ